MQSCSDFLIFVASVELSVIRSCAFLLHLLALPVTLLWHGGAKLLSKELDCFVGDRRMQPACSTWHRVRAPNISVRCQSLTFTKRYIGCDRM